MACNDPEARGEPVVVDTPVGDPGPGTTAGSVEIGQTGADVAGEPGFHERVALTTGGTRPRPLCYRT